MKRTVSRRELRHHAARKVDEALRLPRFERWDFFSRHRTRWRKPHVAQELLARSIRVVRDDPGEAFHRVELAAFVTYCHGENGGGAIGGPAAVLGLRALVEAHYGNIERVLRRFAEAGAHFAKAREWLAEGQLDAVDRARLLSLHASLLIDLYRFDAALRELARGRRWLVRTLERDGGDDGRVELSKLMLQEANVLHLTGRAREALRKHRDSCRQLLACDDSGLALGAVLNLGSDYCEMGDPDAAQAILAQAEPLFRRCQDRQLLLWRTWVQGRVHEARQAPYEARRCFQAARRGFLDRGNFYNALQVSLDLAGVAFGRGHQEELLKTCAEIEALARHPQVRPLLHDEGRAALGRFLLAATERNATPELLARALAALGPRPDGRLAAS